MKRHLISRTEVGSTPATSIVLSVAGLPAQYTSLILEVSARSTSSIPYYWENLQLSFNDNSANWHANTLARNNSTPYAAHTAAYSGANPWGGGYASSNSPANTFAVSTITIPDWRSNHYKPVSIESYCGNASPYGAQLINAGRWNSNDAITSIKLTAGTSFAQYSSVTLYGVTSDTGGLTIS